MTTRRDVLDAVDAELGIRFEEINTGGGSMALQARLETGHWVVAVDSDLCELDLRIRFESVLDADDETTPMGWSIGFYEDGGLDSQGYALGWSGQDSIAEYCEDGAYAHDLANVLQRAIAVYIATSPLGGNTGWSSHNPTGW